MNNQELVAKLWNLCNVLRDDGITYHQYVTELTYILFLKMCKETNSEESIPEQYRWDNLITKQGLELKKFYKELLEYLGENCSGRVREIHYPLHCIEFAEPGHVAVGPQSGRRVEVRDPVFDHLRIVALLFLHRMLPFADEFGRWFSSVNERERRNFSFGKRSRNPPAGVFRNGDPLFDLRLYARRRCQ